MVSYEAASARGVAAVVLTPGTLSTVGIVVEQDSLSNWNFVATGVVPFIVFMIAATAELNRPPFDLVEAEQGLVGGFNTEYSAFGFALFFLAGVHEHDPDERDHRDAVPRWPAADLDRRLNGGHPADPRKAGKGAVWFLLKLFLFLYIYVWIRATLPRLRYDQLMDLGWKLLIPIAWDGYCAAAIQVGQTTTGTSSGSFHLARCDPDRCSVTGGGCTPPARNRARKERWS